MPSESKPLDVMVKRGFMSFEDEAVVIVQNLCFQRGEKFIFKGINLSIKRGVITAIMGPSGVGKSTLLRLIGGQLRPNSGKIFVNRWDVSTLSRKQLNIMRRQMGLLFQEGALFSDLTVFENVAFLLREHTSLPEDMIHDLVLMKLEAVGLRGAHSLSVNELSGGMARRVALARAVMLDPELMMYDEPFTGQDPINRGVLMKLIRELNNAVSLTSVIVSHDVHEVARIADYLYIIADGVIIGDGTPEDVFGSTEPRLQQFIQGLPDGPVPFQYPAANFQEELSL